MVIILILRVVCDVLGCWWWCYRDMIVVMVAGVDGNSDGGDTGFRGGGWDIEMLINGVIELW